MYRRPRSITRVSLYAPLLLTGGAIFAQSQLSAQNMSQDDPFTATSQRAEAAPSPSTKQLELRVYRLNDGVEVSEVTALIRGALDPQAWNPTRGTIFPVGRRLVIRQTPEMHEKIDQLLQATRVGMKEGQMHHGAPFL